MMRMYRLLGLVIFLICIGIAFFILQRMGRIEQTTTEITDCARVLFLKGDARVKSPAGSSWEGLKSGYELMEGYQLKTGPDSWVELGLGEGSKNVVRVKENTLVNFSRLGPVELVLLKGEVRTLIERLDEGSKFEIKTPTAVCGARGTGWDTAVSGKEVAVDVYEHKIYFDTLSKEGEVAQRTIIGTGKEGSVSDYSQSPEIRDVAPEKMEDWEAWRDDLDKRMEAGQVGDSMSGKDDSDSAQKPKVWVEKTEEGDFQLMVNEEKE